MRTSQKTPGTITTIGIDLGSHHASVVRTADEANH
jgi:hypothetical protein